jgi:hypothetical protein
MTNPEYKKCSILKQYNITYSAHTIMNDTETIDRLFLELSQFTNATTAKERGLRDALERIARHLPIMGSTGEYRQGQLDVLESVLEIAHTALMEF